MKKSNLTTLCYIEKNDAYLMLHRVKKQHDINHGKWIGVGGHFEPDETPEECLLREVREETGLVLDSYRLRGIITFQSNHCQTEYMFLYTADLFHGTMLPCDEGVLKWVKKEEITNLALWDGDRFFFHLLDKDYPFFSLKLKYIDDTLIETVLDGNVIEHLDVR